jgi:hypothetical protein
MTSDLKKIIRRLDQRLGEARRFQDTLTKRIQKLDRELAKVKGQRPNKR